MTEITLEDSDSSGSTLEDDNGQTAEEIEMGGVGSDLDAALLYNVTITYTDGTTNTTALVMAQDDMGRLFALPPSSGAGILDDGYIRSIRLDSVHSHSYAALTSNRQDNAFLVCFAEGTRILTPRGEVPVEHLRPGDLVETLDHGSQPVLWLGSRRVKACGRDVPVVFVPGALGDNMPYRALSLSRQHRVLTETPVAGRMFGTEQILVPAKDLLALPEVRQTASGKQALTYWHILLPRHEILWAEGAPVESFLPTQLSLGALSDGDRTEILQKVNETSPAPSAVKQAPGAPLAHYEPARALYSGARARRLVARLNRNQKPLIGGSLTAPRHMTDVLSPQLSSF